MLRIAGYWGPEVGEGDEARRWERGGRKKKTSRLRRERIREKIRGPPRDSNEIWIREVSRDSGQE